MTEVTIYNVLNRWPKDYDWENNPTPGARMSICLNDIKQAGMCPIWCINYENMTVVRGFLLGVGEDGDHYITVHEDDVFATDDSAWAVSEKNIYYDKHSADKALFTAHLKYESD